MRASLRIVDVVIAAAGSGFVVGVVKDEPPSSAVIGQLSARAWLCGLSRVPLPSTRKDRKGWGCRGSHRITACLNPISPCHSVSVWRATASVDVEELQVELCRSG